jgi:L,D-peptidoglycan transpeptidase YkuD (ErfK/YbiS/YcfS/YnhG family)
MDSLNDHNVLIVQTDSADSSMGWARLGERRWRCVVGAGGVREDKVEGDSATPSGEFPLRRVLFRNDRLVLPAPARPGTGLPARPIGEHDGWCDDPVSSSYNRLVHVPNEWSHEKLWREDALYDVIVVVGYNDDPPEGEWGSAIFLHLAREDFAPTKGCVAFARESMMELLPLIGKDTKLRVLSEPAGDPTEDADPEMRLVADFEESDW